ncbi:MAG TPA: NAD(P)H-dependent oxidoreductase [Chthoniobacterales bacterium]|nr:NAD(P)H-dependent oxidoreductase [Chthoniobacterales bacterium]
MNAISQNQKKQTWIDKSATINRQQLLAGLSWRYATKQFDARLKISDEDWDALEKALVLTPSRFGFQPWTFIVIDDPAIRERLLPASYNQRQVVDASHLVVFAAKVNFGEADVTAHVNRVAEVRGVTTAELAPQRAFWIRGAVDGMDDAGRRAMAVNQVYIALGNLITSAALLGIDACPMEGIEKSEYDTILGLKAKGLGTAVVAAFGFRAPTDKYATLPKVRFRQTDVVLHI